MQLDNPYYIEIIQTLTQIERMNQAIAFHQGYDEPDVLALSQYRALKDDFTSQLVDLLRSADVSLQKETATA